MTKKKAGAGGGAKLWRLGVSFGRQGTLGGIFVATDHEVTAAFGKTCYFGEVLGKHSEIVIDGLAAEHVKMITGDAAFIAKAESFGLIPMGFNPLEHIACERCGEPLPVPYEECGDIKCRERGRAADDS